MTKLARLTLTLPLVLLATACRSTPVTSKPAPAASADRKVTEDDLVRVRLTPEAETRLGIATTNAEQKTDPGSVIFAAHSGHTPSK